MRVALVHDWLNGMRGGEKVFEVLCEIFPQADVYTLVYQPDKVSPLIRSMTVRECGWARVPGFRRHYRWFLPVMPGIVESFPIRDYDIVVSTSHCVAKGVMPKPATTPHICYCFTPMRYVWDKYDDYFGNGCSPATWAMPFLRKWLQRWDTESAARVTHFLTSSEYVRERIRRHYMRESHVIPPPVDCSRFGQVERAPQDFYLLVSALEPYKRVDIAIVAFRALGLPLKIVGTGTLLGQMRADSPSNVEFLGWIGDHDLAALYSCARAVIFPTDEDFGIVPIEASASGCPVIAYRKGGALETVVEGETGIFFDEQTPESLASAVSSFDLRRFDGEKMRAHAMQFDRPVFRERLAAAVQRLATVPISSHRMAAVRVQE